MSLTRASNSIIKSAPLSVVDFGADPTGTLDSTDAIQAALDQINNDDQTTSGVPSTSGKSLIFPSGTYLISRPLEIKGYGLLIDGNNSTIRKTTNDLPSPALSTSQSINSNGTIDNNINAIFLVKDLNRGLSFCKIRNFNLEGVDGVSDPIGIYWWGMRSSFENIRMVYVNKGIECVNAYASKYSHIIVSRTTSHAFHHNGNRIEGTNYADSGTSVHFDNCYCIDSEAQGFRLVTLSYASFSACAADFCTEESYYFFQCEGLKGGIGFENPFSTSTTPAIAFWSNSSGHLTIDCFANQASPYPAAAIYVRESKITLSGTLRANYTDYVEVFQGGVAQLENLKIWPVGSDPDDDIDFSKLKTTAGSNSYIYYTPAFINDAQRATYIVSDYGPTISGDPATYLVEGTQDISTSPYRYGAGKIRVIYGASFDTTNSNTFSIPIEEIKKVIPYCDGNPPGSNTETGSLHTVLALRIEVDAQVLHGHWVYLRWNTSSSETYVAKSSMGGIGKVGTLELVDNAAGSAKVLVDSISLTTVSGKPTLQVAVNAAGEPVTTGASLEISAFN